MQLSACTWPLPQATAVQEYAQGIFFFYLFTFFQVGFRLLAWKPIQWRFSAHQQLVQKALKLKEQTKQAHTWAEDKMTHTGYSEM